MIAIPRIAVAVRQPSDVIPHLGKPTHWKQGRSAKAVADSWFYANDIPAAIRGLLRQSPFFDGSELIDAWLERSTNLNDGRASHSQTDLLAIIGLRENIAVMAVEAKVSESFGPFVKDWIADGSEGKRLRLDKLCKLFRIEPKVADPLRYQLLHRTAAALYEAERYRTESAMMVVQSFCESATGFADFKAFAEAIGFENVDRDTLMSPRKFGDGLLWLAWVSDRCPEEKP